MYALLQYEQKIQSLYDRIIVCTKQAWECGVVMLQDFTEYFSMYYFYIINNHQSLGF